MEPFLEPYVGELRLFGWRQCPTGWALCNGAFLSVTNNIILFGLIGYTYGGGGSTFALPDLRGRALVGTGTAADGTIYPHGAMGGLEQVTLTDANLPRHSHSTNVARKPGNFPLPTKSVFAPIGASGGNPMSTVYADPSPPYVPLDSRTIEPAGQGVAHNNMQPFAVANWCIAIIGVYPKRA